MFDGRKIKKHTNKHQLNQVDAASTVIIGFFIILNFFNVLSSNITYLKNKLSTVQ